MYLKTIIFSLTWPTSPNDEHININVIPFQFQLLIKCNDLSINIISVEHFLFIGLVQQTKLHHFTHLYTHIPIFEVKYAIKTVT